MQRFIDRYGARRQCAGGCGRLVMGRWVLSVAALAAVASLAACGGGGRPPAEPDAAAPPDASPFCGNGRLEPGERCASTSNRNFEGRQGQGGRTHLVSPAMAAAAAIAGHFVDIRND